MESEHAKTEGGGGGGAVLLVLLVASIVVILEGWFHAFEYVDELALSILKSTGSFSLPAAQPRSADPPGIVCAPGQDRRYVVVLVPDEPEDSPTAAEGPASDFRFNVIQGLAAMKPAILAVDFDLTLAPTADQRLKMFDAGPAAGRMDDMQWVLTALPIDDETPAARQNRSRRNEWLRKACENQRQRVVVGSPDVATSPHFGHVVQFHWESTDRTPGERPPVFPALGQLVHRLDHGASERSATKGAGFICGHLRRDPEPAARIPFIDKQWKDASTLSNDGFVAAYHADRSFDLAWLNPAAALRELHVASVRSRRDLAAMLAAGSSCLANRIVFVGAESDDMFATAVGPTTPGVLVHAMTAVSAERSLKSRLSLAAALDLMVGVLLTLLAERFHKILAGRLPFVDRALVSTLDRLSPLLVLLVICGLSVAAFQVGWFLNPIVAAVGIGIHGMLHHSFAPDPKALAAWSPSAKLPRWKRAVFWFFPPPRLGDSPLRAAIDKSVYWVLAWTISALIIWAVWIVASRIRLVLL